jgi:hypothetical protein
MRLDSLPGLGVMSNPLMTRPREQHGQVVAFMTTPFKTNAPIVRHAPRPG